MTRRDYKTDALVDWTNFKIDALKAEEQRRRIALDWRLEKLGIGGGRCSPRRRRPR